MAIAEYTATTTRLQVNSGATATTEWSKDWFAPDWRNTGVTFLAVVVVGSTTTINNPSSGLWTRIGALSSVTTVDDQNANHTITFPGGVTMGVYYCREPWGSNTSHKWTWPVATSYAAAFVGFTGVSTINTINNDFGVTSSTSSTLTAPQGFSAGQAGDLVITVGATRIGVQSSGSTYGVGAWTGGVGGLPTTTYTTTVTGKPDAIRIGGVLQATGGQALGGHTAPFTGYSGGVVPKAWMSKTLTMRAETSSTRRSFVYV